MLNGSIGILHSGVTLNVIRTLQISFSRGKTRYMFDFRFELKWEAPDLDEGPAKGVLVYPDFGQDCEGVYEVECRVSEAFCLDAAKLLFIYTHSN